MLLPVRDEGHGGRAKLFPRQLRDCTPRRIADQNQGEEIGEKSTKRECRKCQKYRIKPEKRAEYRNDKNQGERCYIKQKKIKQNNLLN